MLECPKCTSAKIEALDAVGMTYQCLDCDFVGGGDEFDPGQAAQQVTEWAELFGEFWTIESVAGEAVEVDYASVRRGCDRGPATPGNLARGPLVHSPHI